MRARCVVQAFLIATIALEAAFAEDLVDMRQLGTRGSTRRRSIASAPRTVGWAAARLFFSSTPVEPWSPNNPRPLASISFWQECWAMDADATRRMIHETDGLVRSL